MLNHHSQLEARDPFLGRLMAGKYAIDAFLGAGAMGRVYRATQQPLDKLVAVKLLHSNLGADPSTLQRFLREAKAASRFDHPNSVAVFDFGIEPDGTAYIVMEYLRGESLDDLIQREGMLDASRCVAIMSQVLAALSEAHEAGIVHRDLKPENIMLVSRGGEDVAGETVKVADFGIAKMLDEAVDGRAAAKLTATGLTPGSPAYMSPEQAQARTVDGRSDLYQCGVILYEMITGQIPFVAESAIGVIMMHISQAPPSARIRNTRCPEALDAVIAKAMAKEPERRFSTAGEMRQALKLISPEQVTSNVGGANAPGPLPRPREGAAQAFADTMIDGTPNVAAAATRSSIPRTTRWLPATGVGIIGVTVAAAMLWRSPRSERPQTTDRPLYSTGTTAAGGLPAQETALPLQPSTVPVASPVDGPTLLTTVVAASHGATPRSRSRANAAARLADPSPSQVRSAEPTALPGPIAETLSIAPEPPPSAEVVVPTPSPAPAPTVPVIRGVRASLGSVQVTGGLTRAAIQGRASQAADALARCVGRGAEAHGGANPVTAPITVGVIVGVRDRRADDIRISGGGAAASACRETVLGAFRGDLPQAEDAEYEVRMSIELSPLM